MKLSKELIMYALFGIIFLIGVALFRPHSVKQPGNLKNGRNETITFLKKEEELSPGSRQYVIVVGIALVSVATTGAGVVLRKRRRHL